MVTLPTDVLVRVTKYWIRHHRNEKPKLLEAIVRVLDQQTDSKELTKIRLKRLKLRPFDFRIREFESLFLKSKENSSFYIWPTPAITLYLYLKTRRIYEIRRIVNRNNQYYEDIYASVRYISKALARASNTMPCMTEWNHYKYTEQDVYEFVWNYFQKASATRKPRKLTNDIW